MEIAGILIIIILFLYLGQHLLQSEEKQKEHELYMQRYYSVQMAEVDQMTGIQFEEFCSMMLKKAGYTNISLTKASNDQGVDITAEKDGNRYAVQCKRYNSVLSNTPVQEVFAGSRLYGCDTPVVMTNSYFTKGAMELAAATGVQLWNRDIIMDMLFADTPDPINSQEMEECPQTENVTPMVAYWIRRRHFNAPNEYECTSCGSRVAERTDYCIQCGAHMEGSWKDEVQKEKPSFFDIIIGDK